MNDAFPGVELMFDGERDVVTPRDVVEARDWLGRVALNRRLPFRIE